ncbi:MAG: LysE family transporter [Pseudomonadota bacterium]
MDIGFVAVLIGWSLGAASPGPATLALSATAMAHGRAAAVALAAGITTGSAAWGIAAALGLSAIMVSQVWLFEAVRWAGATYLLWLAVRAARRAWRPTTTVRSDVSVPLRQLYRRGLLLHLTNPKAIFGWGSVFAVVLPPGSDTGAIWFQFACFIVASAGVFFGYAVAFSHRAVAARYRRSQRWFDGAFAAFFGAASVHFMTFRVSQGG